MMQKNITNLALLIFTVSIACCSGKTDDAVPPPKTDFSLPYRLDQPDTVFKLHAKLREISGLSLSPDGTQLLAVNDEDGDLFYLNIQTGAIENKQRFGKNNDYEGLTSVGKDIYVVKSNGTLHHIPASGKTKSIETRLNSDYDVEGLTYDSSSQCLLLACKGRAGKGDGFKKKKAIYPFDLEKEKLSKKPAFLIDRNEIARWKGGAKGTMDKMFEFFSADQSASAFGPSGLAFSPISQNLYVIASVGKALAVLRPDGEIAVVQRLNPKLFPQPEGICFDREGRLYISSEGKGAAGRIYRFSPMRN